MRVTCFSFFSAGLVRCLMTVALVCLPFAGAEAQTSLSTPWTPVGPAAVDSLLYGKISGRVNAIAVDPSDATGNTVYVGTLGGGVWKSTNAAGAAGSVTFAPLTDTLPVFSPNAESARIPSLTVGALTVQPGGTGVVLAGTGDVNDAADSYYGVGVLRSADNGLTWTVTANSQDGAAGNHSFMGLGFAGFAWNASLPNIVVAATGIAGQSALVNATPSSFSLQGLYYSTDAGVTWKVATLRDSSVTVQSNATTGVGSAATAVVWNPVRAKFYAAVRYHGYYESADGQTWTRLAQQPATGLTVSACPSVTSTGCPMLRGALTVDGKTGDMYALTIGAGNVSQGLWRDVCALAGTACGNATVSFGQKIGSSAMESGGVISSANYNMALTAVPVGSDTVLYAAAQDIYRCSVSAGCTFRNVTNTTNGCTAPAKVGPLQHAVGFAATATPVVFFGNDSGLWRSTDLAALGTAICSADDANHFQNLNAGLGSLAEVVGFAQHPTDPQVMLVGMGANGTAATSGGAWTQLSNGEGGTVAIDQSNPNNWLISNGAGVTVTFCGKGSACSAADFAKAATIGSSQVSGDVALTHAPFLFDTAVPSNLIVGTCRVWRGPMDSGGLWSSASAISAMFGSASTKCGSTNALIRSVTAAGPSVTATTAGNTGSTVMYAGLAGKLTGGGSSLGGHIFTTSAANLANSTTAWTDVTGTLNVPGFDVSRVYADPHDAGGKTVYATIAGFSSASQPTGHVYVSANGGASWTNISGNLPNVPANDVLVDPNDANTIYVALDTGVYVTRKISTCTTDNCWSAYGTALPNSPAMTLAAAIQMPTGSDSKLGMLRVGTYGRGVWQIPLLTAAAPAVRGMTLSPETLSFAGQPVSTLSASQRIKVTNTGNVALTVSRIALTGDFTETDTCLSGDVATGGTCTIDVVFAPTRTGARTGQMTVYANVPTGQAIATLSGTGLAAAAVVLNPTSSAFPTTSIGASSFVVNFTISNTGDVPSAMQVPTVTGDFAITANTCGSSLSPKSGCTVSVVFRPTASGARTGLFSITDDAGTQTAALTGVGTAPATDTVSPLVVNFAGQQISTASPAQLVTLTNDGDVALTLVKASITSGDFTATNTCGSSLSAHSSCSVSVVFIPKQVGAQTGTLVISDVMRDQTVVLNGTGVAAPGTISLSPAGPLNFAATGVGQSSASQVVTLTNNGASALSISSTTVAGDFAVVAGSSTCGSVLAVNTACSLSVTFKPTSAGRRTGVLTVTDSAPNSPQVLQLTGIGVDFSLFASGQTSQSLPSGGGTISYAAILNSDASLSGAVALSCSGAPANTNCVVNPSASVLGSSNLITVTIATGVKASLEPPLFGIRSLVVVALLVPCALLIRRRRYAVLLMVLLVTVGCGSGRKLPDTTTGGGSGTAYPTPTGTYNIVLTATAAGLSRTVGYTLIVQ